MSITVADRKRKQRIIQGVRERGFELAAADPKMREDLQAEAASLDPKLVTQDLLEIVDAARAARRTKTSLSLFFSSADVIILPGILGSQLEDANRTLGLIWIDPRLFVASTAQELNDLQLASANDDDFKASVAIRADGAIPIIYAGLRSALEVSRYHVIEFGFDWRKHFDVSANALADVIRDRANNRPRPLHIVAHSQGSLIARRALQLLGPDLGRQLVNSLVLLGPATAGSFSAAFGLAGSNSLFDSAARFGVAIPDGFTSALQSMTGLYQLLPWRTEPVDGSAEDNAIKWTKANFSTAQIGQPGTFRDPAKWKGGIDSRRLADFVGSAASIDSSYFNDRTTIILGNQPTPGGMMFDAAGKLVADPAFETTGDGTMPDSMARVSGVNRLFKAEPGTEHMMLPATWAVIVAVRDVLAGRTPKTKPFSIGLAASSADAKAPPLLAEPISKEEFFGVAPASGTIPKAAAALLKTPIDSQPPTHQTPTPGPAQIAEVSPPPLRRLRVFSFDPLFANEMENVKVAQLTIELPWEFADGNRLQPGPVGEYLEVIDYDAASQCFYPPVDLNHPHLLAQDGIPVSEGDPRFHQQMAYAVAMNTIRHFEVALGRVALWAPNLKRDVTGSVIPAARSGDEYVGRLRIYPHAMREQNAYYSPEKKSLLLGYFPATGLDVGRNLPGGMIFSCLSYDIVAHETTHALLDGLHRYFTQSSNPDVFAFHEAFADIVALFQHFSHIDILRDQLTKSRGDLEGKNSLGDLAAQFGEATGNRRALRKYLGLKDKDGKPEAPDSKAILNETEPHKRGAILVAAVFRAFSNIYENRVADLRRIATRSMGILSEGELHPDLVNRLASEAAKSARHLLRMCIRALDYTPPVDLTFGDYLRALITADHDLVQDDDLGYRKSVVAAFRDWGIYPDGVRSLSVDSLLWSQPQDRVLVGLEDFLRSIKLDGWGMATDRRVAYSRMCEHNAAFHQWLSDPKHLPVDKAWELGLALDPLTAPGGIHRSLGKPAFQVHMFRPSRRIGPDGQELTSIVVELIQRRMGFFDQSLQTAMDGLVGSKWTEDAYKSANPDFFHRGGSTLIIDPSTGTSRYCVRKPLITQTDSRLRQERDFRRASLNSGDGNYLKAPSYNSPFEALHEPDCH
jgi:hypothetical protein